MQLSPSFIRRTKLRYLAEGFLWFYSPQKIIIDKLLKGFTNLAQRPHEVKHNKHETIDILEKTGDRVELFEKSFYVRHWVKCKCPPRKKEQFGPRVRNLCSPSFCWITCPRAGRTAWTSQLFLQAVRQSTFPLLSFRTRIFEQGDTLETLTLCTLKELKIYHQENALVRENATSVVHCVLLN